MIDFFIRLKKHWYVISIVVILLFATFLRFYNIDKVPVSLYWDEVSIAYNAFSIANTGKDEYGNSFPFLFKAFNDYKFPGIIYLTVPIVKIFGLTEITARFISAFFGTIAVFLFFFLIKELLIKTKLKKDQVLTASLIGSFSLAISPWHIQFSRGGFEANVGLSFLILGMLLLIKGIKGKKLYFYSSLIIILIAITFYRSIGVFLPLLLIVFTIIFYKDIFSKKFLIDKIIGLIIFFVLIIPLLLTIFSSDSLIRANQVSIFNNFPTILLEREKEFNNSEKSLLDVIFYNRRLTYLFIFFDGYIKNLSPTLLFLHGDGNLRHSVNNMGLLYIYEMPFFVIGLIWLFFLSRKIFFFIIFWILIAPIPAALGTPSPHGLRSLNMLPMLQLLIALGATWIFYLFNGKIRFFLIILFVFIVSVSFYQYIIKYFIETPRVAANEWGDGYKQLTTYVLKNEEKYDNIIISGYKWQPYIYFLFYKEYDPYLFQRYGSNKGFDKYIFGGTEWDRDGYSLSLNTVNLKKMTSGKKVLVALSPSEYLDQAKNVSKIYEVKNINNETQFIIGELK